MMHEWGLVIEPHSKMLLFPVESIVRELDYRWCPARPGQGVSWQNHALREGGVPDIMLRANVAASTSSIYRLF